ncbi:hypothetical protein P8452_37671 [Trifolium repens]|nr:hypothetical protein P8452_37671 [Trifolium repens]
MDGGNHDIMDHNQDLGDGEIINSEQSGVKYPFSFVRHGEDFRWWEYQIPENNNYLEIPEEFSFIFLIGINGKLRSLIRKMVKDMLVIFILG